MNIRVPFLDLAKMHSELVPELDCVWRAITSNSQFIGGKPVSDFEESWALYCNTKHCVGLSDGTAALALSMRALKVKPGDEVIVPCNTFIATWEAIVAVGAHPVGVDVDPRTLLVSAEAVAAAVTQKTVGVIAVHLFGQMVDMDAINRVAKTSGLWVIEDAAQAHGATWKGKKAGSLSNIGCFSFYPGKNLGAFGDAGAIVTNDPTIAENIRSLANHGRHPESADKHINIGMNHRLDSLQAAILSVKLPYLDRWNEARGQAALKYRAALKSLPVSFIDISPSAISSNHLMIIQLDDRERVQKELLAEGIATGIHYRTPCHQQIAFSHLTKASAPIAERAAGRILSLPMFPHLTDVQIDAVSQALQKAVARSNACESNDIRLHELVE
jgi:dTDP-4-amino-4,6-dideoxygalactose transaminase